MLQGETEKCKLRDTSLKLGSNGKVTVCYVRSEKQLEVSGTLQKTKKKELRKIRSGFTDTGKIKVSRRNNEEGNFRRIKYDRNSKLLL